MTTLNTILKTNVAIPMAVEKKFPMLPKLSTQMTTIAGKVPAGPNLPGIAVTVLEPPAPNQTGQPLANFFNSAPVTIPTPGATTTTTVSTKLPLSPANPGQGRGNYDFASMPLSPKNQGAERGNFEYNDTFGL